MTTRCLIAVICCSSFAWIPGCGSDDGADLVDGTFTTAEWMQVQQLSPLPDVPPSPTNRYADNPEAAVLGQKFFFEGRWAGALMVGDDGMNGAVGAEGDTGKLACVDCHDTDQWFSDTRSNPNNVPLGSNWLPRNSPTMVNMAFYEWFAWAGRGDSLWMKNTFPPEGGKNMNSTRTRLAQVIYQHYREEYDGIFDEALDPALDPESADADRFPADGKPGSDSWETMTPEDQAHVNRVYANYGKAMAAYYRLLVSRDAPFDRYVAGDTEAIGESAKRGLKLFIGKAGCVDCHNTPLFSDSDFHNTGVPQMGDNVPPMDEGRYAAIPKTLNHTFNVDSEYSDDPNTGKLDGLMQSEDQVGQFRTKHLRQVAGTGPYMHNGVFSTLQEVVEFYNEGGADSGFSGTKGPEMVPLNLTEDEITDLVAFLETLTGEQLPEALRRDNRDNL